MGPRADNLNEQNNCARVNPYAIAVTGEMGVDVSTNRSKSINEFYGKTFDYVVTVCDHAKRRVHSFHEKKDVSQSFPDPPAFKGAEDKILEEAKAS
jgi:arsenate reductase